MVTRAAPWARARTALGAGRCAALAEAWRALLLSRVLVWATGIGAVAVWGLSGRAGDFDPGGLTKPYGAFGDLLVAPAARWDTTWFLTIADGGYFQAGRADPARPAFFPLYPLLVRAGGVLVGSPLAAGVLISLACLFGALYLLHRLTALELGPDAARATVWLTALFPMAFFFSAVYSEALFLMLSVGCVYAARTGRWAWAGALGALAAGTRSAGVLLVVPLAVLLVAEWRSGARAGRPPPWREALGVALVPAGLAAFCGWLALRGGPARAPFDAQAVWFRSFAWPFAGVYEGTVAAWDGARQLLSGARAPVYFTRAGGDPFNIAWHNLSLWAFLPVALAAAVGAVRRLPCAYGAYTLVALALPLSYPVGPQPLMSFPRFVAVVFPLFMWAGWWITREGAAAWRGRLAYGASAVGLAAFGAQFATWHWVA